MSGDTQDRVSLGAGKILMEIHLLLFNSAAAGGSQLLRWFLCFVPGKVFRAAGFEGIVSGMSTEQDGVGVMVSLLFFQVLLVSLDF